MTEMGASRWEIEKLKEEQSDEPPAEPIAKYADAIRSDFYARHQRYGTGPDAAI